MHTAITLDGGANTRLIGSPAAPWLVRTASLDGLTPAGEETLRRLGVGLVIDLREPSERSGHNHGLPVRNIPLYGSTPPVTGSLESVYAGLLRERGHRLAAAVSAIAEHPGTVAVHCTAGKDRTGLVVMLARLLAGDSPAAITADYALSGAEVFSRRAPIVSAMLAQLSLEPAALAAAKRLHLESPPAALEYALDIVQSAGGAAAYLLANGMRKEQLTALAARGEKYDTGVSPTQVGSIHSGFTAEVVA